MVQLTPRERNAAFDATDDDLLRRACAAWFRSGGNVQPDLHRCSVTELEGLRYVVLKNVDGLLAVYRVKNDGMLRAMARWPKAFGK